MSTFKLFADTLSETLCGPGLANARSRPLGIALAIGSEAPATAFVVVADAPPSRWNERVNELFSEKEWAAVRLSAQRGRPRGDVG